MSDYIHSGSNKMNKVEAYKNDNKLLLADKLGHAKVSSLKEQNLVDTINTVATHDTDITQLKTDMNKVRGAYVYKGTVETEYDLPLNNNSIGDVYNVSSTGMNYAWNGTSWDELGSNDENLVHKNGNEVLNGNKTFSSSPLIPIVDPENINYTGNEAVNYSQIINLIDNIDIIGNYYALKRTGKVYQTRFPLYETSSTTAGTKLLDNTGLVCVPSTDTVEGQDDYADIPLFQWINCNYIRLDDGTAIPIALEGTSKYKTEGMVDIGVMQMSFYWKYYTDEDYCYFTISDSPHPELGLIPWYECVKADGTILPYCIGSKYMAGYGIDNKPRSLPNLNLWNRNMSYTTAITNFQTKGSGYWGAGLEVELFQIIFFAIKYAEKNMQSIMMGCTSYNQTDWIAKSEIDTKRILLTANNTKFVKDSFIQLGSNTNTSSTDRNTATNYDIADHIKINSVEQVEIEETTYTALNLNLNNPITTILGGIVATTPWNAGSTDLVLGKHDGSIIDNSLGIYPYRIQGREYAVGSNTIACNIVLYNDTENEKIYHANKNIIHTPNTTDISTLYVLAGLSFINNQANYFIGNINIDAVKGIWYPISAGTGNSVGWCDQVYLKSGSNYASGWRQLIWGGALNYGLLAGPCRWSGSSGLGDGRWEVAARD